MVPLDNAEDVLVDTDTDSPQNDKMTQLMDYVTNAWIEPPWMPKIWNNFGNVSHRRNNHLEGWLHKINR